MPNNDLYTECPSCLVELGPDATINQLRRALRKTMKMLDECLAPRIDHRAAYEWLDERNALRKEVEDLIGPGEELTNLPQGLMDDGGLDANG